jgi:hypothetical protein
LAIIYQHFAVFDLGFLCNPAIDIEHVLPPGGFLPITLNELDLLIGDKLATSKSSSTEKSSVTSRR